MSIDHLSAPVVRNTVAVARVRHGLAASVALGLSLLATPSVAQSMSVDAREGTVTNEHQPRTEPSVERLAGPSEMVTVPEAVVAAVSPVAASTAAGTLVCTAPEPTARWSGRRDDDDWATGLYPTREDYPEGWLALTFDDGPHRTRTPKVLDQLARHQMHATFFLTGFAIRASSYHLVRRMVDEGHTIANHGWSHDVGMTRDRGSIDTLEDYLVAELELTQIRVDMAMMARDAADFAQMDARVFESLRRWDGRERELEAMPALRERHRALLEERGYSPEARPLAMRWMRPPGGIPYMGRRTNEEREAFARVVDRLGLEVVMWSGGTGDSSPHLEPEQRMDPARIAKSARKAARRGGIYVAHDRITTPALRSMIKALARSDAKLVSLAQMQQAKQQARGWCSPMPAVTPDQPMAVAVATAPR